MNTAIKVTTCQICARPIKSNTGTIAHHGYTRPGLGWQTASCLGAKHLPYEESRDRIPAVLDTYKTWTGRMEAELKDFLANPPAELTRHYVSPYTGKRDPSQDQIFIRPKNFNATENLKIDYSYRAQSYERQYNTQADNKKRNVKSIKETRDWLQERWNDWKPAR